MSMDPAAFRKAYQQSDWIFDLFAHIFDHLHGDFFPPDDGARYDALDQEEKEVNKLKLIERIRQKDGQIPDELRRYIDLPGDDVELKSFNCRLRLYCVLRAIDNAAADLNYMAAFVNALPGQWTNVREVIDKKRSLERMAQGHVLFRPHNFEKADRLWFAGTKAKGQWERLQTRGVDLQDYFHNLLRVEQNSGCSVELDVVPAVQDIVLAGAELQIAVVPLIQSLTVAGDEGHLLPGPLRIVKEPGKHSLFGIHIAPPVDPTRPCHELCERAGAALRYLAEQGAHIVLFPEMVVPDPVLRTLKQVLYDLTDQKKPRPSLVLAGSFSRNPNSSSSQPPYNVAVMLNSSGSELWRQRKLQPYEMKEHEQKRFGLYTLLNSNSCMENMMFEPRILELRDSKVNRLRMVTLICEDATRAPGLTAAKAFEANLIFVPVMAGPLSEGCGFATSLDPGLNEYDAIYVVANSAGLARNAWNDPKNPVPLGIIGLPLSRVDTHKPHVLLTEIRSVPGVHDMEVLYYQLPEP